LSDRIGELKRRAAEVASQIVALADKRRSYAFAAVSDSDVKARKLIADIDFESDSLRKEQATISDALEIGEALARQQELDLADARRRERSIEAYSAARGVITLNEEIDLALVNLRELFERRSVILKSLANTSVVDPNVVLKLSSKSGPTSAAHKAGLGRFLNIDMMPIVSQRGLSDTNSLLLTIGEAPSKANGRGSNGR
jgi:hypothetical protein